MNKKRIYKTKMWHTLIALTLSSSSVHSFMVITDQDIAGSALKDCTPKSLNDVEGFKKQQEILNALAKKTAPAVGIVSARSYEGVNFTAVLIAKNICMITVPDGELYYQKFIHSAKKVRFDDQEYKLIPCDGTRWHMLRYKYRGEIIDGTYKLPSHCNCIYLAKLEKNVEGITPFVIHKDEKFNAMNETFMVAGYSPAFTVSKKGKKSDEGGGMTALGEAIGLANHSFLKWAGTVVIDDFSPPNSRTGRDTYYHFAPRWCNDIMKLQLGYDEHVFNLGPIENYWPTTVFYSPTTQFYRARTLSSSSSEYKVALADDAIGSVLYKKGFNSTQPSVAYGVLIHGIGSNPLYESAPGRGEAVFIMLARLWNQPAFQGGDSLKSLLEKMGAEF